MPFFHYYDLVFSEVFIFDDYIINQVKEGEEITPNHDQILSGIVTKHFKERELVYISNRIKNYSVDSLIYKAIERIPNLSAIIIITNQENNIKLAKYEKTFFSKPFIICKDLAEAMECVDKIVLTKNKI
ncbi:hypothetical protein [Lacinutrix sp.]|uniref:hypothetical protein n=1 Tax=Lacinutrix sp. TaxID=1937692 RepID=UPI0025C4DC64|nr:hypothetical protein [Lacinutrix sp.]